MNISDYLVVVIRDLHEQEYFLSLNLLEKQECNDQLTVPVEVKSWHGQFFNKELVHLSLEVKKQLLSEKVCMLEYPITKSQSDHYKGVSSKNLWSLLKEVDETLFKDQDDDNDIFPSSDAQIIPMR